MNNLEDEIRAIVAGMDNQEKEQDAQNQPEDIQDIYVLIVREQEVEEDQSHVKRGLGQIVESEPVKPPDKPNQPFPYLMLGIILICAIPMLASILLQLYLLQNPPIATITIIPKSQQLTRNGTLQMGRLLPQLTLSQSATTPTTGRGHQDAKAATGTVTFYNGLFTQQFIASGTVYTGQDGIEIVTTQDATIPAGSPNTGYGTLTVTAQAIQAGSKGNIQAGDIAIAINNGLLVRNNEFHNGQDERNFQTVAKSDITNVASTLKSSLERSMQGALQGQLKTNEQLSLLPCSPTVRPNHNVGDEAIQVTITVSLTCSAVAYNAKALENKVRALLTSQAQSKLAGYSLFGDIQMKVNQASVTNNAHPLVFLSISASGEWIYGLSRQSREHLKELIAGKSKDQALQMLASLPGVERGSISFQGFGDDTRLPKDSRYIHFVILIISV